MRIESLELEQFRNYRLQRMDFDPRCNVIFGANAQGKTNLLEAILYLSCGKSPRARSDREMIGFDAAAARLTATVLARERVFQVQAELFRDRRRKLSVNKVPAKNSAALSEVYHTVYFRPEDLFLIREGAAARRKFLDAALCQLRPRYAAALTAYGRLYDHKTRILRDSEERPDLLAALPDFNEQMVRFGAVLIHYRAQFAQALGKYAAVHHRECSGGKETLEIRYQTVSSVTDPFADLPVLTQQLREHMERHQAAERASRLCLSGPHKDDLSVTINGKDAKMYASQGQTRTAALSMKLAEREIYQNATGEYPVLLLDDVLSELDPRRQEFVLNRIAGGQVFITCCEDDRLPELLGGKVLHVHGGELL
ncbi:MULTISPECIES: DNA replication/repair protein RecF [environmental samples]|uniref:DNA replication/repair protein RecF n=1 Tax=environmental samples TaxID=876090 RepID=UPI0003405E5F|nr:MULTISPECIES: DNA replication/repair protein RecF [environmental samples]CDC74299.1 dNA replication and repair protein RecF [Oscillibacter sp. CAG:155]